MNEPVFDDATISEHATRIAQSVRAINHLSLGPTADEALPYQSDVAAVVSDLTRAVHGLPQALEQLATRTRRLAATGRVRDTAPERGRVDRPARADALLTAHATQAAARLAAVLDAASADLAQLAYDETPAPSPSVPTFEPPRHPERRDGFEVGL